MQILAVVVRYDLPLTQSETLKGLCHALSSHPDLVERYSVLVWDNSLEALNDPQLPIRFAYRHSRINLGVSGAFNGALEYARENGNAWMLLLDQDTSITPEFLRTMQRHVDSLDEQQEIAAIAPTVFVKGVMVSPARQIFGRHVFFPPTENGVADGDAFAINSGCMMRVPALSAIGGFSLDFWLDYSDRYVFHQFFLSGYKVWHAADTSLEHDMSIMDYDRLMTPWRYRNFSHAESAYWDLYGSHLDNFVQNLRLFARAVKQRFKYVDPVFSHIASKQLLFRLSMSRRQRLIQWVREGEQRRADAPR